MKIVVIGLGSMGKRRVRNLFSNGIKNNEIVGFDIRADRCSDAVEKYGIQTEEKLEEINLGEINAMIISVPPDRHIYYMNIAVEHGIPCFVEASVVDDGMDEIKIKIREKNSIVCPSCTLKFHPAVKTIKNLIDNGNIGKVSNFSYHSGQYLPDWHPWEDINDFYVSNLATGGGREIVPFELTWLNWVFGNIKEIKGFYRKTINLDAPIDDTYVSIIEYGSGVIGSLVVDVVSRKAIRHITINGDCGQIVWDWSNNAVELYDADRKRLIKINDPEGHAAKGYNVGIIEEMYSEEIYAFLSKVRGTGEFPNTIEADHIVLKCLYELEKTDERR